MNGSNTGEEKRFARATVWISLLLAAFLVAGVCLYAAFRPSLLAMQAREAAFAEDYVKATDSLALLWEEDQQACYAAVLEVAGISDYRGNQEEAIALIEEYLATDNEGAAYTAFSDRAKTLLDECVYHQAMELYGQGAYAKASALAATISHYEPAGLLYQLSYQALLASQPTPVPTSEPSLSPTPEPSPQPTREPAVASVATAEQTVAPTNTPIQTQEPAPVPTTLPDGRVAVGYHHAVFLRDDGTVLAYGDNSYGQTDVGEWRNIVAVSAGAYHTVGLTADGRVLATGDNAQGQTEVSIYTNVQQVAANAWNTCLLLESGQVMTTGYLSYDFALELVPAEQIAAGSYGLIVRSQGKNTASHPGLALDDRCVRMSISRGYAVGIDDNGHVISTTSLIPQWENVAMVSAGENAVLALTTDGTVLSHSFGAHVDCSFDFGQPVLALCAGPNQYAFVLRDGSIEIRYADGTVFVPEETLW